MAVKLDDHPVARLMVVAIKDELVVILGDSGARALSYYADPDIAGEDAVEYERRLVQVLGGGSRVVSRKLRDRVCSLAGNRPGPECTDMTNCRLCVAESLSVVR